MRDNLPQAFGTLSVGQAYLRFRVRYRLVFRWDEMTQEAYDVYFTDYHRG